MVQKLAEAHFTNVPIRDTILKSCFWMIQNIIRPSGINPCRAVADTDVGSLAGRSHGGSTGRLHAEEDIAEQYYVKKKALNRAIVNQDVIQIPVKFMYVDIQPCGKDEFTGKQEYSGHQCENLFTKGKVIRIIEDGTEVSRKFEFQYTYGTVFYLMDLIKGNHNLGSLWAAGLQGIIDRWAEGSNKFFVDLNHLTRTGQIQELEVREITPPVRHDTLGKYGQLSSRPTTKLIEFVSKGAPPQQSFSNTALPLVPQPTPRFGAPVIHQPSVAKGPSPLSPPTSPIIGMNTSFVSSPPAYTSQLVVKGRYMCGNQYCQIKFSPMLLQINAQDVQRMGGVEYCPSCGSMLERIG